MAMSRKDYVSLAISMGLAIRFMDENVETRLGAYGMLEAVIDSLNASNMNFDKTRFRDFVNEVAEGKRNAEGKIVKNAA
jgi:hypothetical protein